MDQGDDDDGQEANADYAIRVAAGIGAFTCEEWNGFAGTTRNDKENGYNPLVSFAFLSALEDSGCAIRRTGWQGHHLRLETAQGRLLGAVPCYLKSHSQGEYVFDHGWSDAFERAGGRYYPKLQCSVPFTPVTGPRLLVSKGESEGAVRAGLAEGLKLVTDKLGVSSAHVTFANEPDVATLEAAGFLHRTDQQFHFFNEGFSTYDDFLATLASRKRKAMKKERREALADGISIDWLTGKDITEKAWDDFFAFYMDTGGRKWGRPYLNRQFFSLIGERMADDILLVMAKRNGRYIAGAINFIGSDALYGRNWGCIEDHPFLHFEVCYHQAIDFAIERKLKVVEAGAQGEHKLARGYRPVTMHSAHYISHPGLRNAVADYLRRERREVERMGEYLEEHTPFRKDLHE
ncbi:GNAT family N-acetyltransferase [Mesorhizobium sp. M2D.F.Ca.ET.185.01.1.1]|uniref:GNAT family N-acetyltransferase n=1 Tax=unclassified Mesorhizobium TaxID=325217 RepID=UPI000FCB13E0|nr:MULTISPECIES: GNAT family N-acetyltransferase [unclassified Mesorhizobium]TGP80924.1 GNAT family N-acetyltransferase [bacterium M00.F.Ca.ET.227.01.1.1]TGP90707.1 GNAT family N-acetyltransferase [bacterium M00.F.Ca.ET.221.01.1.1]TGP97386.1 GNAT family N-acetyltransferase [bacterium M00.F.Ca.ET.222.01.1.1]TGT75918.1 GNAT family N-acetyltransferase [bacterium M00.F.Ca.ET.159.01.1.1]TGT84979.1 GNAT family N-acetyltransferase [bacterium M00.F.Ca.ET.157.01.1.1]TGU07888.1 GNAT family N-acetyltran